MGKLKDAHIFSNEEGAIAKFFARMALYLAACLTGEVLSYAFLKKPVEWWGILLLYLCLAAGLTAIYFITKLLAYRTKVFPKAKYREAIHGVSFFLLSIIALVLLIVLV